MGYVHVPSLSVLKETLCFSLWDSQTHGCRGGAKRGHNTELLRSIFSVLSIDDPNPIKASACRFDNFGQLMVVGYQKTQ